MPFQFPAFKDIFQMATDAGLVHAKEFGHLVDGQPDGLVLHPGLDANPAIVGLVEEHFAIKRRCLAFFFVFPSSYGAYLGWGDSCFSTGRIFLLEEKMLLRLRCQDLCELCTTIRRFLVFRERFRSVSLPQGGYVT